MNNAYLFIAVIVLGILLGLSVKGNMEKSNRINELEESITAYNKAQTQTVKTVTKIREVVKNVNEDCYNTVISDDVLKLLHNNK